MTWSEDDRYFGRCCRAAKAAGLACEVHPEEDESVADTTDLQDALSEAELELLRKLLARELYKIKKIEAKFGQLRAPWDERHALLCSIAEKGGFFID